MSRGETCDTIWEMEVISQRLAPSPLLDLEAGDPWMAWSIPRYAAALGMWAPMDRSRGNGRAQVRSEARGRSGSAVGTRLRCAVSLAANGSGVRWALERLGADAGRGAGVGEISGFDLAGLGSVHHRHHGPLSFAPFGMTGVRCVGMAGVRSGWMTRLQLYAGFLRTSCVRGRHFPLPMLLSWSVSSPA